MTAARGGRAPDYRSIEPHRARRIRECAFLLGWGSIALGALLLAVVGYVAATLIAASGLLVMTVATLGSLGVVVLLHGVVAMVSRRAIFGEFLELGAASATRRDLLVVWNFAVLLACLGWFSFAVGLSHAHQPVGPFGTVAVILAPAVAVGYTGIVTVRFIRLLRA